MSFGFGFALPAYPLRGGGGNNPFNQSGPTLDLSFAGVVTDLSDPNGYTLTTDFIVPQYQVAAQYTIWETGVGLVNKAFGDIITFTRASSATFTGSNGLIQSATTNTPRFDYDPVTLAAKGLLIEEQRTNLLLNSVFDGGGAAPTSFTQPIATGTSAPAASTVSSVGTAYSQSATAQRPFIQQTVTTVASTVYILSMYIEAVSGLTYNDIIGISGITPSALRLNGATVIGTDPVAVGRLEAVLTASGTSSFCRFGIGVVGNATGTIRFSCPQVEAGSFATSYIPATASQVTRSADVASVNTLSPWFNANEGTLYAEYTPYALTSDSRFAAISDGSNANRLLIYGASASTRTIFEIRSSSTVQADLQATGTFTTNTTKVAGAYKENDFAFSVNGAAALTDTSGAVPSSVNSLTIGSGGGTTRANGHIRRITYYPRKLSSAELQAITA